MERKQEIQPGTRWGTLTYIKDMETDKPSKRPILVKCDCGVIKTVDLAALRSGSTGSCSQTVCRNKRRDMLLEQVKFLESRVNEISRNKDIELNELRAYWREIESTGNVHNISHGMLMTRQFLVN